MVSVNGFVNHGSQEVVVDFKKFSGTGTQDQRNKASENPGSWAISFHQVLSGTPPKYCPAGSFVLMPRKHTLRPSPTLNVPCDTFLQMWTDP